MSRSITRSATVFAAALLITGGTVVPAGAVGTRNDACNTQFGNLVEETWSAKFTSRQKEKDQGGLVFKALQAQDKFQVNKVADSLQKLADYASKVDSLVAQHKVEDATRMLAAHAAAVTCVSS